MSKLPLLLSKEEYARILKWTDENKEDPEVARKTEYVKYLEEKSAAMIKNWPNSVENVNKRNEEIRQERQAAAENANNKFYKRYVKRKIEEQERLMYNARDIIFKNKDAPRTLISAVVESLVLKEREEQKKFSAELKRQEEERKRQEDQDIIRKAEDWYALREKRKQLRFEMNKKHQKELTQQATERAERERKEHQDDIESQKIDNILAAKEMEQIAKFESEFKEKEKQRIFEDMKRAKEERDQRLAEQADMDKLGDRITEVLDRSKARVERLRKEAEAQERAEKLRVLATISERLTSGDAARDAHEHQALMKAQAEREAAEEARREERRKKDESLRKERIQARQEFLQQEEQKLHELQTRKQWELVNRFKNQELYEEYLKKQREEKERKIQQNRENLLAQQKERKEFEAAEQAHLRDFYGPAAIAKTREADNKLLTYAQKLIDEARAKGWPTYPIEKARYEHCKRYRLYPETELPKALLEHFQGYKTVDLSRPDPDFKEAAPPPADLGPDHDDDDDAAPAPPHQQPMEKTNGLQDLPQAGCSKPKAKEKNEELMDYKRTGPANGLQRGPQLAIQVTSIPMRPASTTPACTCDRKMK